MDTETTHHGQQLNVSADGRGLAVSHAGGLNTCVLLDLSTPGYAAVCGVRLEQGEPMTETQALALLGQWQPLPGYPPVTATAVRGVRVGVMAAAFVAAQGGSTQPDESDEDRERLAKALTAFAYRKPSDREAVSRYVAVVYSAAASSGSAQPTRAVSEALGISPQQARSAVRQARRHGYLTPGIEGKAGGVLTPQARQALEDQQQDESKGADR